MTPGRLEVGRFRVFGFREGRMAIDGGAMFGVVPKSIWRNIYSPDEENRIELGLNSLLVDTGDHRVLIETGVGDNLPSKLARYYDIRLNPGMTAALRRLGYGREDIDFIINTHLHFDHCGGNTRRSGEGEFQPAFPNAVYIIQRIEWENARSPVSRDKPSYLEQTFAGLDAAKRLTLVNGEMEILPGIFVIPSPGHTAGHQCVLIESQGESLLFLGDLVPTSAHMGLSYIMSFDLYPLKTWQNKRRLLEKAAESGWLISTSHDPACFFGRVERKGGKFLHKPLP